MKKLLVILSLLPFLTFAQQSPPNAIPTSPVPNNRNDRVNLWYDVANDQFKARKLNNTDAIIPSNKDVASKTTFMALSSIRTISQTALVAPVVINITDKGMVGTLVMDPSDHTTPDNTGTCIVTSSGIRYKRQIIANMYDLAWFGAVGDGSADDTEPVQSAVNEALKSANPAGGQTLPKYGTPGTVLVPVGTFRVHKINVDGSIRITGQGGGTYALSFFLQHSPGESILELRGDDDATGGAGVGSGGSNSTVIENIGFKSGVLTSDPNVAQIKVKPGIASNSVYIRNDWFQTPETNAIWLTQGDDIQISGCTFDVSPNGTAATVRLGTIGGGVVSNCTVFNNTFYQTSGVDIKLENVLGMTIALNRVYTSGTASTSRAFINGVGATNILSLAALGNNLFNVPAFCLLPTNATSVALTGNTGEDVRGTFLYLTGGGVATGWTITGNSFRSLGNWNNYPITGDGCGMQNSIISNNSFLSATTTLYGVNLSDSRVQNNTFSGNQFSSTFTNPYNVANKTSNQIVSLGSAVQGDSPTSRTSYFSNLTTDSPSGFFKYNGTVGTPSDPSGFNEWLGIRIRNETSTGSGGVAWKADLIINEKTKIPYIGGYDGQTGLQNSFDRIWTKSALPIQENATHTNLYTLVYNGANGQYEPTSPANLTSVVMALGTAAKHNDTEYIKSANNLSDVNSVSTARNNLGIGGMGTQDPTNVSVTGGTVSASTVTATVTASHGDGSFTTPSINFVGATSTGLYRSTYLGFKGPVATGPTAPSFLFTSPGRTDLTIDGKTSSDLSILNWSQAGSVLWSAYMDGSQQWNLFKQGIGIAYIAANGSLLTLHGSTGLTVTRTTGNVSIGTTSDNATDKLQVTGTAKVTGTITGSQYKLSALNTAPTSATDTGTTGEIRVTAGFIYICTATNTWVRATLSTW